MVRIGAGALGVGLLVGATVGLFTRDHGTAAPRAASTTTSSVPPPTVALAPNTTVVTVPPPVVIEFLASPASAVCGPDQQRTRVVVIWSTQSAQSVALEADGSTLADGQPPTGRYAAAFDCPASGETDRHELVLTATGGEGMTTTSKPIAVAVTTPVPSGGDHGHPPDGGGNTSQ